MNFSKQQLNLLGFLQSSARVPHAVILSGGEEKDRAESADILSAWAVCADENRPCGVCKNCVNAFAREHSDIYFAKTSGKTKIFSVEELNEIVRHASLKPNQANCKVFIFEECDKHFPELSQNVLLKTLEEPPSDTIFILTCSNSSSLLSTIRSRATEFPLENTLAPDAERLELAKKITRAITASSEIELLKATNELVERTQALDTLGLVRALLRDGLALCVGARCELDGDTARILCRKLTKAQFLKLIEITLLAEERINQNVTLRLVPTWLSSEYRRTIWQK